jgi:hypothetical protein
VICAQPPDEDRGLAISLTTPLPLDGWTKDQSGGFFLQLADGSSCTYSTGASAVTSSRTGSQRANFSCDDHEFVFGNISPGVTWFANKGGLSGDGQDSTNLRTVAVLAVWK